VTLELDHLVLAARTLEEGVAWCEATLGITPAAGGEHPLMGTHNRVFAIGGSSGSFARSYFEIIAIDPQAPPPGRARWFGLDRLDLSRGPRLVNVVARTHALDALLLALQRVGIDGGRAVAASRDTAAGFLEWRIAVRDDGALSCGGALPTLIEWGARHPADALPPSGVTLKALTLRGVPPAVVQTLDWPGVRFDGAAAPALEASFDTPLGAVILRSD
jgi:hypothetical protein